MHHSQQHRNYHVIFVYIFKFASLSPLPFEKTTEKGHSNWYSQAVSHASTDQAQPCLTSEIRCVQGGVAVSYRWTSKLALKTQSSLSFDNSFCAAQCSAVTLYLFIFIFFPYPQCILQEVNCWLFSPLSWCSPFWWAKQWIVLSNHGGASECL